MNETANKLMRVRGRATAGVGRPMTGASSGMGSAWWPFGTTDDSGTAVIPTTALTDDYVQHIAMLLNASDFESATTALSQLSKNDLAAITPRLIALGVQPELISGLVVNGETINVTGSAPMQIVAGRPLWQWAAGFTLLVLLAWFAYSKYGKKAGAA